jgi:hypothetical protein
VRPLPRVLAYTNDEIARREDFGILAAALAAAGPAVALVARAPDASADALTALADRCVRLARAPEAMVLVSGRADIAAASDAHGVILRGGDIAVADARQLRRPGGPRSRCCRRGRPSGSRCADRRHHLAQRLAPRPPGGRHRAAQALCRTGTADLRHRRRHPGAGPRGDRLRRLGRRRHQCPVGCAEALSCDGGDGGRGGAARGGGWNGR